MGEANQAVFGHLFPRFARRAAQRGPRTLADYCAELIQVAAVEGLDRQRRGPRPQED